MHQPGATIPGVRYLRLCVSQLESARDENAFAGVSQRFSVMKIINEIMAAIEGKAMERDIIVLRRLSRVP
jgi:hypothetical protein